MADLTDLEITKLCAEALKYECDGNICWAHDGRQFRPITDDAQAMALVKKMELAIYKGAEAWRVADEENILVLNSDLNRAICECVARMQLEKNRA